MRFYFQQALRGLILFLFTMFIIKLHRTGDLLKLINPKYTVISMIGAAILFLFFLVQLQRVFMVKKKSHVHGHDCSHDHDHGDSPITSRKMVSYAIISLPIVMWLLIPLSTLDSSIAEKKAIMLNLTNNAMSSEPKENDQSENKMDGKGNGLFDGNTEDDVTYHDLPADPNLYSNTVTKDQFEQIEQELELQSSILMSERVYAVYYDRINQEMDKFVGKEITVTGFVYKEADFASDQLVLGRFLITHCVADASIIGFLTEMEDAASIAEDTWIEVKGTIFLEEYNGSRLPAIRVSSWKEINEPAQPYLYPLTVKLV
ncbi:TIGR03943 family putative permease subunit [Pseudogracilibacillus auburnensis]|uniref:Putative membrane protein n=1 Tax=Pseudogracilibacillus auburnensis TaxID=1494959 RepID=A0A2V3VSU7_9BACI|nr:TIGR03943 family protein [Pseudogracilibacillus auburnensis]PXW83788.1 putative membrane protein [Pseudogracilibacillus auburnensis]